MTLPSGSSLPALARDLAALGKALGYTTRQLVLSVVPDPEWYDDTFISLVWFDEDEGSRDIGNRSDFEELFAELRWQDSKIVNRRFEIVLATLRSGKAPPPPEYRFGR